MKHVIRMATAGIIIGLVIGSFLFLYEGFQGKPGNRPPYILAVIKSIDPNTEFWNIVRAGIDAAAEEFDAEVETVGPQSESDVANQIQILEGALKTKPAAIVMAANDFNALVPTVEKLQKAGIIIITIDSGVNCDLPVSFIATDNIQAGRKVGESLAGLVRPEDKIAIISHVKVSATAIEREQGVKAGLGKTLEKSVVGTYYCNASKQKAYEITKDLLTQNQDIRGIAGLNEPSTLGAAEAIKELYLVGKVKLVGFDSSVHEIKLIEEGVMQATVVQKPFNMGYLGIKTAVRALKGEKIEPWIDTGSQVINRENMYTRENQKLLFPFVNKR